MANINKTLKGGNLPVIGGKHPRLDFERMNSDLAAVLKKVVDDVVSAPKDAQGRRQITSPSIELLTTISRKTASNVNEANSMMQLLPDVELARLILVSSILSPNDLTKVELHFSVEETNFSSELTSSLIKVIEDHFEKVYKIKKLLPSMLSEALFEKGAYPLLILPENTIDDVINSPSRVSIESIAGEIDRDGRPVPLGILGSIEDNEKEGKDQVGISLESFAKLGGFNKHTVFKNDALKFSVTDNPSILKLPLVIDKITQDRIQDVYSVRGVGLEAKREQISTKDIEGSIYRRRRYKYVPVLPLQTFSNEEKPSVGHPLVMKLPTESVIPVHVPSNPEEHIGYFVLLDNMGNPLSKALESDYYNQLQHNLRKDNGIASQLLDQTMRAEFGRDERATPPEIEQMLRSYTNMVEHQLINSLKNGIYGESVQISKPSEIFRIMFARAAANMHTQLLYVPVELLTYIAFDYNSYGVGRSLLENSKLLGSIRAVLMFANTMAAVKNSVGHTDVKINLDPQDPDPTRTVEFLVHEYTRTSKAGYPLGESNPTDIIDYLQKASINLQVSGHPGYPETSMDVSSRGGDRIKPDTELEDAIRQRHIMSLGLSPETIDTAKGPDFATSVVNNNLLLTKRVLMYQDTFTHHLEDFVRKYTLHSSILMDDLRDIIEKNKKGVGKDEKSLPVDRIIMMFLEALRVSLPSPESSTLRVQMEAFSEYSSALDAALEAYFSDQWMTSEELDDLSGVIPQMKLAVKAYFQRQWLRNNNALTELDILTTFDEKNSPAIKFLEVHKNHIEAVISSVGDMMLELKEAQKRRADKVREWEEKNNDESGDGSSMGEDADSDDFGSDEEDGLGDDSGDTGSDEDLGDSGGDDTAEEGDDESAEDLGGEEGIEGGEEFEEPADGEVPEEPEAAEETEEVETAETPEEVEETEEETETAASTPPEVDEEEEEEFTLGDLNVPEESEEEEPVEEEESEEEESAEDEETADEEPTEENPDEDLEV